MAFLLILVLKRARSTRLLAFLLILVLDKRPEQETVGILANSGAHNELLAFFPILVLGKGPDHETVSIFATFKAKKTKTHGPPGKF